MMSKTVTRTTAPVPAPAAANGTAVLPKPRGAGQLLRDALKGLASLRLTVVFFALGVFLVFSGTLAMMDEGLWTVLNKYFRSWYVVIPFQVFVRFGQVFFDVPKEAVISGGIPFLGGWSIGAVLMTNLLAAHIVRFKFSGKRSGILLIHSGIAVMMVGEFITGLYQVEGNLRIPEGGSSNFVEHHLNVELAIVTPADEKTEDVVVVPASLLRKEKHVRHDDLPFDVELVRYMVNSELARMSGADNPATHGLGRDMLAIERKEIGGTDAGNDADAAAAYVTLKKKHSGELLGTYLVSVELRAQPAEVNGKTYQIILRPERMYKPYTIHLYEVRTDRYEGSSMAKEFSSRVRLLDPTRNEDRDTLISMNSPLRHGGETFYQSRVLGNDDETVLQVVRNPGVWLPYISCCMVALGMIVHFGLGLNGFLRQRVVR